MFYQEKSYHPHYQIGKQEADNHLHDSIVHKKQEDSSEGNHKYLYIKVITRFTFYIKNIDIKDYKRLNEWRD